MPRRIRVDTDVKRSYIQGRNGLYDIHEIEIWETEDGNVFIDGIGKRGNAINGGLHITKEAMTEIAKRWLADEV